MGGVLASCAASCAGTVCGSCISQCCDCGENNKARAPYVLILFLSSILALVLRFWGGPLLIHLWGFNYDFCTDSCSGYQAVYRISFALFVMFALVAVTLFCTHRLHAGMWLVKLFVLLGTLVGAFFIPNSFFVGWAEFCRYLSFVFLLFQIVMLIDFSYVWNEEWKEKEWFKQILGACAALLLTSYVLAGYFFSWFATGDACGTQRFFIGFTFALTIGTTSLSLSKLCPHGALLPSSVVTAYAVYLLYSSLSSDPTACNSLLNAQSSQNVQLVINILLAAFSIVKSAWDLGKSNLFGPSGEAGASSDAAASSGADVADPSPLSPASADDVTGGTGAGAGKRRPRGVSEHAVTVAMHDRAGDAAAGAHDSDHDKVDDAVQRKSNLTFHASMALASLYLSMLLTNWGSAADDTPAAIDVGWPAVWVKIVSQWVTLALYAWTLVAPSLFPNRDFS